MFGIGFPELVVIFIVALLVLGPERLPQVAKTLAHWVQEFRRAADELKKELGADELERGRDTISRVREELLKDVYVPLEPEDKKADINAKEKETIKNNKTSIEKKSTT